VLPTHTHARASKERGTCRSDGFIMSCIRRRMRLWLWLSSTCTRGRVRGGGSSISDGVTHRSHTNGGLPGAAVSLLLPSSSSSSSSLTTNTFFCAGAGLCVHVKSASSSLMMRACVCTHMHADIQVGVPAGTPSRTGRYGVTHDNTVQSQCAESHCTPGTKCRRVQTLCWCGVTDGRPERTVCVYSQPCRPGTGRCI
jgi:hypothetical protein